MAAGEKLSINGSPFAVTPDSDFVMQFPLDTSASLAYAGYAAVIFLDLNKKEIKRLTANLGSSQLPLGDVRTDASGTFVFPVLAPAPGSIFRAYFPGNDAVRAVGAESH
jgi:hypothetical protein